MSTTPNPAVTDRAPHVVIVCYKPLPGKEDALERLIREHVPILRRLGMATERRAIASRAEDGTIVEVFEWVSGKAVEEAHQHPEVLAMWKRFEACCTFGTLAELPRSREWFPAFAPIAL